MNILKWYQGGRVLLSDESFYSSTVILNNDNCRGGRFAGLSLYDKLQITFKVKQP